MCRNVCGHVCGQEKSEVPGLAVAAAVAVRTFLIGLAAAGRSMTLPSSICNRTFMHVVLCVCLYIRMSM